MSSTTLYIIRSIPDSSLPAVNLICVAKYPSVPTPPTLQLIRTRKDNPTVAPPPPIFFHYSGTIGYNIDSIVEHVEAGLEKKSADSDGNPLKISTKVVYHIDDNIRTAKNRDDVFVLTAYALENVYRDYNVKTKIHDIYFTDDPDPNNVFFAYSDLEFELSPSCGTDEDNKSGGDGEMRENAEPTGSSSATTTGDGIETDKNADGESSMENRNVESAEMSVQKTGKDEEDEKTDAKKNEGGVKGSEKSEHEDGVDQAEANVDEKKEDAKSTAGSSTIKSIENEPENENKYPKTEEDEKKLDEHEDGEKRDDNQKKDDEFTETKTSYKDEADEKMDLKKNEDGGVADSQTNNEDEDQAEKNVGEKKEDNESTVESSTKKACEDESKNEKKYPKKKEVEKKCMSDTEGEREDDIKKKDDECTETKRAKRNNTD